MCILLGIHRHYSPLLTTTRHYSPLLAITHRYSPLLITTRHYSSLLAFTHHYSPLLITTRHYSSLLAPTHQLMNKTTNRYEPAHSTKHEETPAQRLTTEDQGARSRIGDRTRSVVEQAGGREGEVGRAQVKISRWMDHERRAIFVVVINEQKCPQESTSPPLPRPPRPARRQPRSC